MKTTKYIAAAVIAATALGVATPAFASGEPEAGVNASDVGVTIRTAEEGEEEFVLKTVPAGYNFESSVKYNGEYTIDTPAGTTFKMTAFKNFESGSEDKFTVSASVSDLVLNDNEATIEVTNFVIGEKGIGGSTGEGDELFGDTDFTTSETDPNIYSVSIDKATIEFEKQDLVPTDELTGTVTYTQPSVYTAK